MDEATSNRLSKAVSVKRSLRDMEITEESCPELVEFSKILNNWARNDEWASGKIKLYEINKKLVYDLRKPEHTMVKLSEM